MNQCYVDFAVFNSSSFTMWLFSSTKSRWHAINFFVRKYRSKVKEYLIFLLVICMNWVNVCWFLISFGAYGGFYSLLNLFFQLEQLLESGSPVPTLKTSYNPLSLSLLLCVPGLILSWLLIQPIKWVEILGVKLQWCQSI